MPIWRRLRRVRRIVDIVDWARRGRDWIGLGGELLGGVDGSLWFG